MHAENRMNGAVLPVGLLALLVCNIAAGAEYHVSPYGDDGRNAPRGSGPPAAVVECTQAGFVKMEAD
jgi:hypothetical protein